MLDDARHLLNQLFHGETPERFVFTLNCTDALNMAFKGVLATAITLSPATWSTTASAGRSARWSSTAALP